MRNVIFAFSALLPRLMRYKLLNWLFGWQISDLAEISRLCLVSCRDLTLGAHAKIGALTVVKGLDKLSLGEAASIGRLNWITGFPKENREHFCSVPGRDPSLIIGAHAAITNRHIVDCTDRVELGEFSTFAGFRSQILTHSIDLRKNEQSCKPVKIESYCFIGTGALILGGALIPDKSIVAAGSVVTTRLETSCALYGGVPARCVRLLSESEFLYFSRDTGRVV